MSASSNRLGKVWPKNGTIKANKTITVSILDPIDPGLEEKNLLEY